MQIKIIKYLNRPFPYQIEPKYKWFDTFGIGFLIAILLLIFQPFGIEILTIKYKNLLLSVFGIIYAVVNFLYYTISPKIFTSNKWTVKNEIIVSLLVFFVVDVLNWLYAVAWIPAFTFSIASFLQFQYYTLTFGALPVLFFGLIIENQNLKNTINSANTINKAIALQNVVEPVKTIQLNGFTLKIDDILYFNSYQNYIDIVVNQNNTIKKLLHRTTLKQLTAQLADYPQFVQCHKSFIVNKEKIQRAEGNSQGLILTLKNCNETVPVSRSYVNMLKNKISNSN
ncbi:MAG: putative two-component response-regulatory protein YehT [Bacteroidetes bacterium ADurb.Bin234]|nr:MAG: putative two-component response-regulatory protein YehT [Bacteroidetes bacterium ADurb.Bin234]